MNDPRHPEGRTPEERELQALFDATAEPASPEQLHRMARAAAQIPDAAAPAWWRAVARYARVGLVAASAVAVAVVWLALSRDTPGTAPAPMAADSSTESPDTMATGSPADGVAPDEETVEMLAVLDEVDLQTLDGVEADFDVSLAALEAPPLAALDVLWLPDDDAALDELAAAYDEVVF